METKITLNNLNQINPQKELHKLTACVPNQDRSDENESNEEKENNQNKPVELSFDETYQLAARLISMTEDEVITDTWGKWLRLIKPVMVKQSRFMFKLNTENENLKNENKNLTEEDEHSKQKLDLMKEEYKSKFEANKIELEQHVAIINLKQTQLENKMQDKTTLVANHTKSMREALHSNQNQALEIKKLKDENKQKSNELDRLIKSNQEQDELITKLEEKNTSNEKELGELKVSLNSQNTIIKTLKEEFDRNVSQIEAFKQGNKSREAENKQLKEENAQLADKYNKEIDAIRNSHSTNKLELTTQHANEIKPIKESIADKNTMITTLNKTLCERDTTIATLELEKSQLQDEIKANTNLQLSRNYSKFKPLIKLMEKTCDATTGNKNDQDVKYKKMNDFKTQFNNILELDIAGGHYKNEDDISRDLKDTFNNFLHETLQTRPGFFSSCFKSCFSCCGFFGGASDESTSGKYIIAEMNKEEIKKLLKQLNPGYYQNENDKANYSVVQDMVEPNVQLDRTNRNFITNIK